MLGGRPQGPRNPGLETAKLILRYMGQCVSVTAEHNKVHMFRCLSTNSYKVL